MILHIIIVISIINILLIKSYKYSNNRLLLSPELGIDKFDLTRLTCDTSILYSNYTVISMCIPIVLNQQA